MNKIPPIQKEVVFEGSSLDDLRAFPREVRQEAGYQLDHVQRGMQPADWKPMPTVGSGVNEIRLRDADRWYRVMYVAKLADCVYVLHAFRKQTARTARTDIELSRKRYAELVQRLRVKS
jgi:phage-related protein